ncbi:cupin-like domain-containing protein [Microbulbifer agarilyticus]|uniref:cupin-like domain-containing protein n=1 Tax=Microbulbifer agarilyticus TaxID=260552 RepID=UPI001CD354FC|nr:cupin-like domain-containing protein [Microbulbifer agarilyticus]MCA0902001.1 cupin-like domain-containing protein [Microbulbifer agarilyticus]
MSDYRVGEIPKAVLNADRPLVLRGACEHWPAVESCRQSARHTAAYLCEFYSGAPINAAYGGAEIEGRVFYNDSVDGFNFRGQNRDLRQLLQEILESASEPLPPTLYMASTDVQRWFPGFADQNPSGIEDFSPIGFLWLGNRTRIAAHYDFPKNLACNIAGRRRFILFPPEQIENLYPGPLGFAPGGQEISMVDFRNPDFKKFPNFRKALAEAVVVTLNPGDSLIIPEMWWHHVEGLDDLNVLYSHWWVDAPAYNGSPSSALMHTLLSMNDLSPGLRSAWKAVFDYYVFDAKPQRPEHIPASARGYTQEPLSEKTAVTLRAELLKRLQ